MWLGPPDMNRKMTAFALAGMSGFFGASGFMLAGLTVAPCNIAPTANAPNPPNASVKNSRRFLVIRICSGIVLVYVEKSVQVKHRQSELPARLRLQKCNGLP